MLSRVQATLSQTRIQVLLLVLFSVVPSLIFYVMHRDDLSVVIRHWDGPNYIEVAKTLYFIPEENPFRHSFNSKPAYYACHLPLFPLLIRAFAFMSYPVSMIFVTLLTGALATLAFYWLLKEYQCVADPFFTAWLSTVWPIRYVLYKSIGSTEPLYLLLAFLSLIAYKRNRLVLAFSLAGLAGITRITGILMAVGYFLDLVRTRRWKYIPALALVGLPILLTFCFYQVHFGDFLAYFHWNASMIHPTPGQVFRTFTTMDQSVGAEFYYYQYVIYGIGTCCLMRWPPLFCYCLPYYVFALHIYHNDLSRYLIPIVFLSVLVGFDDILKRTGWRYLLPIFFYWAMFYGNRTIVHNLAPMDGYNQLLQQPTWP